MMSSLKCFSTMWMSVRLLLVVTMSHALAADAKDVGPIDATSAYKLFKVESSVRNVHPEAEALLRSVIDDATQAAIHVHRAPSDEREAITVLEAIQLALVKHNFLQPPEQKDWPQTIGIALQPLNRSAEEVQDILKFADNANRVKHLDLSKPLYFVDCDMGSQLFIAVAERLGWDFRLVEVPDHNFIRYHLPNGSTVNWDWTRGRSSPDSSYPSARSEDVRVRALYLRSFSPEEAYAYFLGLIASKATKGTDAERLFAEAMTMSSPNPTTLNNFAWLYATKPEFADKRNKVALAVRYSLGAWSMKPDDGNVADTVACALAAGGEKALAQTIEDFAIKNANSPSQADGFRKNLARIVAGKPCQ